MIRQNDRCSEIEVSGHQYAENLHNEQSTSKHRTEYSFKISIEHVFTNERLF